MIKVHHIYGLLFCLTLNFINGFAQDSIRSLGLKQTNHFGAILPHRQIVNEVIEGHTFASEVSFYKATSGKNNWQQQYNYPRLGVSALYVNFGNPTELGESIGVFPFIELPLNQRKIQLNFKVGYGIGYISKPFDRVNNYKNVVIGSFFNALIYLNLGVRLPLSQRVKLSSGLSIIHFSNGSFERPNLGVNIASISTGLSYEFGNKITPLTTEIVSREKKWTKQLMVGFGVKETPPVDGPKYFVNTYSFNMIKLKRDKSSYGFGADLFYDASLQSTILRGDELAQTKESDNFRLGVIGIYSFDFGKISLLLEIGGYLYTKYEEQGFIYNRFTSRFNVSDKVFLNLGLKTHYAVADFVEAGIGINIGK